MEEEFVKLEEDRIFAEKLLRNKLECEEKTKKNAEKRKRKKGKKVAAKKMSATGAKVVDDDEDLGNGEPIEGAQDGLAAHAMTESPYVEWQAISRRGGRGCSPHRRAGRRRP